MGLKNIKLEPVARTEGSWEVAGHLSKDTTYVLRIESGDEWDKVFTKGDINVPQPVNVTIVSPDGGLTKLQAFFFGSPSTSPFVPQAPTAIVEVKYIFVNSGSLKVEEESTLIRFTVKQGGTYKARVIEEELKWATGPPLEMIFFEEFAENRDFYMFIRSVGGVLCSVGVIVSIWGAVTTKRIRVKKGKILKK
jgi:hypothetical protein